MKRTSLHFASLSLAVGLLSLPAAAQKLSFEAVVGADGKVTLQPKGTTPKPGESSIAEPEKPGAVYGPGAALGHSSAQAVYLWKDDAGAVKGVLNTVTPDVIAAFSVGDSIQALPTSATYVSVGGTAEPSSDFLRGVAQEAGKQLMQAALETGCAFNPLPVSITPTVEISFSLFAGGSISISAEWNTDTLCPTKSE